MKTIILSVIFIISIPLKGQTDFAIKVEKKQEYKLKHLNVSEEDFKEPITFENENSIFYTHNGIFSKNIYLSVINKQTRKTHLLKIDIGEFTTFRAMAMRIVENHIYIVGFSNENKIEILKINFGGNVNKIINHVSTGFVPNNSNIFLVKDTVIAITSFYYPDASKLNSRNLNINYYNLNLIKIDSVSIDLGVTAFSSIYPQKYFYTLKNRIHFMEPSNGNTYTFQNGNIEEITRNNQDGLNILNQKLIDTLTHYSIRKDIMRTFWKANDLIYDSNFCYYFFKTPISDTTFIVGVNGNKNKKWFVLHKNGKLNFDQDLNEYLNKQNKDDYFSYYYNALNNLREHSTILIRNGKIFYFKKHFYYTNFYIYRL